MKVVRLDYFFVFGCYVVDKLISRVCNRFKGLNKYFYNLKLRNLL